MSNRLFFGVICISLFATSCQPKQKEDKTTDSINVNRPTLAPANNQSNSGVSKVAITGPFDTKSKPITTEKAVSWVHNFGRQPITQLSYNIDEENSVQMRSFEVDNKIVDAIRGDSEIKGLRFYFAKRTNDTSKNDYTILVVGCDRDFKNIYRSGKLAYAYDWHKPGPPSTNAFADTLGQ